jgi:tetratricopeptide (TPR) repeat protein
MMWSMSTRRRLLIAVVVLLVAVVLVLIETNRLPRIPVWAMVLLFAVALGLFSGLRLPDRLRRALDRLGFPNAEASHARRLRSAIATFDGSTDPRIRLAVAQAQVMEAATIWNRPTSDERDRLESAIETYAQTAACFGHDPDPAMQTVVGEALYYRGVGLKRLGRFEEAANDLEGAAARFRNAADSALHVRLLNTLITWGGALADNHRTEEAIEVFSEAGGLDPDGLDAPPEYRTPIALRAGWALTVRGHLHARQGRLPDALADWATVVERYGGRPAFEGILAQGAEWKAKALLRAGRPAEAVPAFDAAVEYLAASASSDRARRDRLVLARATALWETGRDREAIDQYRAITERPARQEDTEVTHQARLGLAWFLMRTGDVEESVAVVDQLLADLDGETPGAASDRRTRALRIAAQGLARSGRLEEALQRLDRALESDGVGTTGATLDETGECRADRAAVLGDLGRVAEGLSAVDDLISELRSRSHPNGALTLALGVRATLLAAADRGSEAEVAYRQTIEAGGEDGAHECRGVVAEAGIELGRLLLKRDARDEALAAFRGVDERLGGCSETFVAVFVAAARIAAGDILAARGDEAAARALFRSVAEMDGPRSDTDLARELTAAQARLAAASGSE